MSSTDPRLVALSTEKRQLVECWLADFDQSWHEGLLWERVKKLPPAGNPLRLAALAEMVKIDIERHWQAGKRVSLEQYLRRYPELGTPQAVSLHLVQAELEARQHMGEMVPLADLLRRFPGREGELRSMLGEVVGGADTRSPGLSTPALASEQPAKAGTSPSELPEQFGRYRILKKLGQGGMGAVYLAHDTQLDRQVALKVPNFGPEAGPEALARFHREAKSAATLHHPNLCPVYDVGEHQGVHFLTMAFIEGKQLSEYIKDGKGLAPRQAATLVRTLALALMEAHAKGVIHRDLKPSNVMMNQRKEPVIMDFGLARRAGGQDARITKMGAVMGTPAYMAPEQVQGDVEAMGPSCDIYSLGVILYELLTGKLPFEGPALAVLAQILTAEAKPPSKHKPDLDAALEAICMKSLAKKTEERYGSMADLAAALTKYLRPGQPSAAATAPGLVPPKTAAAGQQTTASKSPPLPTAKGPPAREKIARKPAPRQAAGGSRGWLIFVLVGLVGVLALSVLLLSGVIFRVQTKMGVVVLIIKEPGAQVYVDGELKITVTSPTEKEPIKIEVSEGEHEMKVVKGGLETWTRRFTLRPGTPEEIRVELRPDPTIAAKDKKKRPDKDGKDQNGWVKLFNGKDLTGWHVESGDAQHWSVEDGAMVARCPDLGKRNYVLSDKDYSDFTVRLEVMADPGGAGGVVLRGLEGETIVAGAKLIDHPVIKFADHDRRPQYWPGTTHFMKDDKQFTKPSVDLKFQPGVWHTAEVTIRGDRCTAIVDGKAIVDLRADPNYGGPFVPGLKRSKGRIGFQAHTGTMRYRRVEIKELPPSADQDFVSLFNGVDLTGWVNVNTDPGTFFARDGKIVTTGKPYGFLRTEKQFENFELELDWMHVEKEKLANSGLFIWCDPQPAAGKPFPRTFEVQVLVNLELRDPKTNAVTATSHGDIFSAYGARCTPDRPHPLGWERCLPSEHRAKGGGEWNHYKVVARDGTIKLHVNGKGVSGVHDCTPRKGHIALQSEGSECHFKNIRIKELPPSVDQGFVPLFNGKDLTGWKTHPNNSGKWRVEGGILIGSGDKVSHLFSERGDFESFHFRIEVNINDGGNSGQYFRASFGPGFPRGYEAQINATHRDPIKTGSLYPSFDPTLSPAEKEKLVVRQILVPPDTWFTQEVIALGNRIVIRVNGQTTVDFVDRKNTYARGHLALQMHDPQTMVRFRKVEVRELKAGDPLPVADARPSRRSHGLGRAVPLVRQELDHPRRDVVHRPGNRQPAFLH
jgi:predicted Ser/Thr protein kinase